MNIGKTRTNQPVESSQELDGKIAKVDGIPTPAIADNGKVIKVNAQGKYELASNPVDPTDLQGEDIAPKDVTASGNITGNSIIENMSGYSLYAIDNEHTEDATLNPIYFGICKNGNKLTIVFFVSVTKLSATPRNVGAIFQMPASVVAKLTPYSIGGYDYLNNYDVEGVQKSDFARKTVGVSVFKYDSTKVEITIGTSLLELNEETYVRVEQTFLLSDNLVPQE